MIYIPCMYIMYICIYNTYAIYIWLSHKLWEMNKWNWDSLFNLTCPKTKAWHDWAIQLGFPDFKVIAPSSIFFSCIRLRNMRRCQKLSFGSSRHVLYHMSYPEAPLNKACVPKCIGVPRSHWTVDSNMSIINQHVNEPSIDTEPSGAGRSESIAQEYG
jgi:hypothetical protein